MLFISSILFFKKWQISASNQNINISRNEVRQKKKETITRTFLGQTIISEEGLSQTKIKQKTSLKTKNKEIIRKGNTKKNIQSILLFN